MRNISHAIFGAVALAGLSTTPAVSQDLTVGLLLPLTGPFAAIPATFGNEGPASALRDIFARQGLEATIVLQDTESNPRLAVARYQALVATERPQLVIGPLSATATIAIARLADDTPTFSLASLPSTDVEARLRDFPNLIAFGSIPDLQLDIVRDGLRDGSLPRASRRALVLGRGAADSLASALDRDYELIRPAQFNPEELASQVRRVDMIAGAVGPRTTQEVRRTILATGARAETIVFSPPPAVTRFALAGRLAAQAWQRSGGRSPGAVLAAARTSDRYDADRGTMELFWSILMLNSSAATQERNRDANQSDDKRAGDRGTGETTSTTTSTCSCKNANDEMVNCSDCASNQTCERKNEGTNDCTAECKAS